MSLSYESIHDKRIASDSTSLIMRRVFSLNDREARGEAQEDYLRAGAASVCKALYIMDNPSQTTITRGSVHRNPLTSIMFLLYSRLEKAIFQYKRNERSEERTQMDTHLLADPNLTYLHRAIQQQLQSNKYIN